jgi:effector-binding domain-containing protein
MASYDIVETTEQDYLYVIRKSSMAPGEIAKAMGNAYEEIWAFMQANTIPPAGPALAVYYDYAEDVMEFRVGFVVAPDDAAKAAGTVLADKIPATRAVHAMHIGPYSGLQELYSKIMGEMKWNGHRYGKPTWELYHNDPDVVPEAELKTEIFMALA